MSKIMQHGVNVNGIKPASLAHAGLPVPRKANEFVKSFTHNVEDIQDDRRKLFPPKREFAKKPE